jgi:3-deoxy-D-manno-octulosonic acid kinase
MTLTEVLRQSPPEEPPVAAARRAGEAVGRLHAAGIDHADLNLGNVLVSMPGAATAAHVIDLDQARVVDAPLGWRARRRNLRRLRRSWRRVMHGAPIPPGVYAAFRAGYEAAGGGPCEC